MVQEAEALRSQTPRYHFKSNPKPLKTQKDKTGVQIHSSNHIITSLKPKLKT